MCSVFWIYSSWFMFRLLDLRPMTYVGCSWKSMFCVGCFHMHPMTYVGCSRTQSHNLNRVFWTDTGVLGICWDILDLQCKVLGVACRAISHGAILDHNPPHSYQADSQFVQWSYGLKIRLCSAKAHTEVIRIFLNQFLALTLSFIPEKLTNWVLFRKR